MHNYQLLSHCIRWNILHGCIKINIIETMSDIDISLYTSYLWSKVRAVKSTPAPLSWFKVHTIYKLCNHMFIRVNYHNLTNRSSTRYHEKWALENRWLQNDSLFPSGTIWNNAIWVWSIGKTIQSSPKSQTKINEIKLNSQLCNWRVI